MFHLTTMPNSRTNYSHLVEQIRSSPECEVADLAGPNKFVRLRNVGYFQYSPDSPPNWFMLVHGNWKPAELVPTNQYPFATIRLVEKERFSSL